MSNIANLLDNIKIIHNRLEYLRFIQIQSQPVIPIKWVDNSCWLDSALMVIFAYPQKTILDNIINKDHIDVKKITSRNKIKCDDQKIEEIHQSIKKLYNDMRKNECSASDLWKLMHNCVLVSSYGSFEHIDSTYNVLQIMYPDAFGKTIVVEPGTLNIQEYFREYIKSKPLENNKLLGVAITYTADIELFADANINSYNFKLIGTVYNISDNHIRSVVRTYNDDWYEYDQHNNMYVNLGFFDKAQNDIVARMFNSSNEMETGMFFIFHISKI